MTRMSREGRAMAAGTSAVCVGVLIVAAMLRPDARGYGTHEQLGLGACNMLEHVGMPCPFCGMTTAFSLGIRGRVFEAIAVQPVGVLILLATVVSVPIGLWCAVRGRRMERLERVLDSRRFWICAGIVLLAGWIYSIVRHVT